MDLDDLANGGIHTVAIGASDVQGRLFGRRIPARRLLQNPDLRVPISTVALAWSLSQEVSVDHVFAGSQSGWHDVVLAPDLTTLRSYPGVLGTAICMADVVTDHGEPLAIAPRSILQRQIARAQNLGYALQVASELEFYLFQGSVQAARAKRFRDLEPTTLVRSDYSIVDQGAQEPFISVVRSEMEAAGILVHACQAEYGLGQWEISLEEADPLEMADRHAIFKAGVKEIARTADLTPTFMALPQQGEMGSSCHIHVSLHAEADPVFPDTGAPERLSPTGMAFLGGLMHHLGDTALLYAPYVNSYKRHLARGFGGGVNAWGRDNRTVTFRVLGADSSLRIEHRYPGADVNPYLALAALIAAGIDGIENGRDPGPAVEGDAYQDEALRLAPQSLGEALAQFEGSPFAATAFGKDVVAHYAAHASAEWDAYLKAVTDWEVMRAFELA